MQSLSFATAYATMKIIDQYTSADFDSLGITDTQFKLVNGNQAWRRDQLNNVMRTLNALIFGTLEVMAIPKIVVPAEYVAAIVATLVAPCNRMTACVWLSQERQTGVGALELSARGEQSATLQPASASQLFALVLELSNNEASSEARKNFMRRLGIETDKATNQQNNPPAKTRAHV